MLPAGFCFMASLVPLGSGSSQILPSWFCFILLGQVRLVNGNMSYLQGYVSWLVSSLYALAVAEFSQSSFFLLRQVRLLNLRLGYFRTSLGQVWLTQARLARLGQVLFCFVLLGKVSSTTCKALFLVHRCRLWRLPSSPNTVQFWLVCFRLCCRPCS